ncbi:Oligopeptide transport system permease protein oppC [Borrelia nietonii YOR]|uniref:Oligopeptide transport system permease protein oppC n=1 Tax=Borrelia nietonii YOR TaxID=1293576 RepID=A0ABM5PHZ6_9SPIR|nr:MULTISPECIES: ABC transporter permease subunit [Borrelia]AHH03754.1 Oligopeptide transport system permease protein oppC [Borrelia nietonii YOR]AHH14243.1 Oligopeptide transport system permease protein oppC [Borrelia hermsii MTW]UPA09427.1 ABC transporter permease subunit [Borrelia nietonii YOR]
MYKLKKLCIISLGIFILFLIIIPELINENSKFAIYKKDPNKTYIQTINKLPQTPTATNPLGTDKMGRDILARLIIATRNSILLAFSYATISAIIGIFIGIIIGSLKFKTCLIISKPIEALQTIPFSYILMLIFYYFAKQENYNILKVAFTLALIHGWIKFSFIARNNTLLIKNLDYVKASKTMGASQFRIIIYHIFPEVFSSISSIIPLQISKSLTTFEVINFLQQKDKSYYPSLGELLGYIEMGREYAWIWAYPLMILLIINIILTFISSKLKKHMKYFISS